MSVRLISGRLQGAGLLSEVGLGADQLDVASGGGTEVRSWTRS